MSNQYLDTPRLLLIPFNREMIDVMLMGDQALAAYLQIEVPPNWTLYAPSIFEYSRMLIPPDSSDTRWGSYLLILKEESCVVGSCGYKGPPDEAGMIEVGYEIHRAYQNNGLATEATAALIQAARFYPGIKIIRAYTLPKLNASCNVLQKNGFILVDEQAYDPGEGTVWKWELY